MADKIGYEERIFQSGPNKASGHPLREMTDQQEAIFQKMVNDMYERFLTVVSSSRRAFSSNDKLKPIADGRIYTAAEAHENGLTDGSLYMDQLIEKIKKSQQLERVKVVIYNYGQSPDSNIYSKLNPEINLLSLDIEKIVGPLEPGLHYLWLPVN